MTGPDELRPVDGLTLSEEHRAALRPGEAVTDENGKVHHFPRFFFEVPTWEEAHSLRVANHFKLSELMTVDSREADLLLRTFPHYVPCAILALARYLEDLRREVDAPVFVSANGGYRSPAHRSNQGPCLHSWGSATLTSTTKSRSSVTAGSQLPSAPKFSSARIKKATTTSRSILVISPWYPENAANRKTGSFQRRRAGSSSAAAGRHRTRGGV
jgi:hypothetical protein